MKEHRSDEGVSDMVAAILLVGLTVFGVAIVAAIFLSSPQLGEIPHATIIAGSKDNQFVLIHEGGDPLKTGEYRIYADTGNELRDVTSKFSAPPDGMWSIGDALVYEGGTLEKVVVTAMSGGSETVLAKLAFEEGVPFDSDPNPVIVPRGVWIVSPGEGEALVFFKDGLAAMKAKITLEGVDRVDFMLYLLGGSSVTGMTSQNDEIRRDQSSEHSGSSGTGVIYWDVEGNGEDYDQRIQVNGFKDEDDVVMIAIAYNKDKQVIGVGTHVTKVKVRT